MMSSHFFTSSIRIPTVFEEIKHHSKRLQHEITQLPAPPSGNPQQELLSLLISFAGDVKKLVEGSTGFEWFIQSLRDEHGAFDKAIKKSIPEYIPLERKDVEKPARESTSTQQPDAFEPGWALEDGVLVRKNKAVDGVQMDGVVPKKKEKVYLCEIRDHLEKSVQLARILPDS